MPIIKKYVVYMECDTLTIYLQLFMIKRIKVPPLQCVGRNWKKAPNVSKDYFHSLEAWPCLMPLLLLILSREVLSQIVRLWMSCVNEN